MPMYFNIIKFPVQLPLKRTGHSCIIGLAVKLKEVQRDGSLTECQMVGLKKSFGWKKHNPVTTIA